MMRRQEAKNMRCNLKTILESLLCGCNRKKLLPLTGFLRGMTG